MITLTIILNSFNILSSTRKYGCMDILNTQHVLKYLFFVTTVGNELMILCNKVKSVHVMQLCHLKYFMMTSWMIIQFVTIMIMGLSYMTVT